MARKKSEDADQPMLIEVDHPAASKFKACRRAITKFRDEQHIAKKKADAKEEEAMVIVVEELKVKPDANGDFKFLFDGATVSIKRGKAQLKIKDTAEASVDEDPPADEGGETPPEPTRRGK